MNFFYETKNETILFIRFLKKCQTEKCLLSNKRPHNLYLVKSPRKENPNRKIWRVKRQLKQYRYIYHFEENEQNKAYAHAKFISSLSKDSFISMFN